MCLLELFGTAELGHSQLINTPTHKNGNILDILFTNIPEMVNDIKVLGYKEACSTDHFAIDFKVKLDISQKMIPKRYVYNYAKADWKSLNFDLKIIDWNSFIGTHDPHKSCSLFKTVVSSMRSLFRLDIHIIYSEFISQSSNYTVRDDSKSRTQG